MSLFIAGHNYDSCASIFLYFKSRLKGEMREPIGVRDLAVFRLVDMFNGRTRDNVKDVELESFCNPTGCLRIIIATVAFGLGLDCPNVRRIIHWGHQMILNNTCKKLDELVSLQLLYYTQ